MADYPLISIDQLNPVGDPSREHVIAAMLAGVAGFLTVEQILSLVTADDISGFGEVFTTMFPETIHAASTKSAWAAGDEFPLWDGTSGELRKIAIADFVWQTRVGVGGVYTIDTSKTGAEIPPSGKQGPVFVELTAGLTGAGQFNEGKLASESVSGSAPLVLATAAVNLADSPMNGQVISLLNTEGRHLRPSASPGALQNDAFQGHRHFGGDLSQVAGSAAAVVAVGSNYDRVVRSETDGTITGGSGTPRTANETRVKSIGVKAYMRIK